MSLVLRFVDKDGEIREEFLVFLHCELGLTGIALAETILTEIGNLTLDINNCRGQAYDGAARSMVFLLIYLESMKKLYTFIVTVTN